MIVLRRRLGPAAHGLVRYLVRMRAARLMYRLLPASVRLRALAAIDASTALTPRFGPLPALPANRHQFVNPHDAGARPLVGLHEGVNVFGHLHGEFGLAESARTYATALIAAGIPVALNDLDHDVPHSFGDRTLGDDTVQGTPHRTNLVFVSPDYMRHARAFVGPDAWIGRTTIGCWFWELEEVPAEWRGAIDEVDAIMVASRFTEGAFRRATDKPVFRVPLPVSGIRASQASRADFGLPADAFVFLVSFDFNSSIHRKNPMGAIGAFKRAFPRERRDAVTLVVKTSNGHRYPEQLLLLVDAAKGDPRICVRDQVLPIAHMRALQECADAYVSLHRAEGFGLGLAESMAMGKPVIATAWSGNTDFMASGNSCLVDFKLVPVYDGEYPHGAGMRWAEPDVGHAATWMRRLVDEPGLADAIGRNAASAIATSLCPHSAARAFVEGAKRIVAPEGRHPCQP